MVLNSFRSTHLLPILTKLLKMRQEILPHPTWTRSLSAYFGCLKITFQQCHPRHLKNFAQERTVNSPTTGKPSPGLDFPNPAPERRKLSPRRQGRSKYRSRDQASGRHSYILSSMKGGWETHFKGPTIGDGSQCILRAGSALRMIALSQHIP